MRTNWSATKNHIERELSVHPAIHCLSLIQGNMLTNRNPCRSNHIWGRDDAS